MLISAASFYRILSAFSLGAQKLGQILMLPSELIPGEICRFFANTLNIHGNGERPDLGYYSSFESFLGPEIAPSGHVSSLKMSCITEGENRSSFDSSKLADKESEGPQKATEGGVNGSQSKFLTETWLMTQNQPDVPLY
jgi:hypothetical protein